MKTFTAAIVVLLAMAPGGRAWAGFDSTNQTPQQQVRLELDLVDGSHVIGVPKIESVPLQTAYARMEIPLRQILTLRIDADHETVSVEMANGDRLTGVLSLGAVELTTLFGSVSVGTEHISGMHAGLKTGLGLPAGLKEGLVLYYSFDKDDGNKVTDLSGKGYDGEVKDAAWTSGGKVGGACRFDGSSSYISVGDPKDLQAVKSISAWVRSRSNGIRQAIVSKHASVNNGYPSAGYYLLKEFDNKFLMAFCVDGNPDYAASASLSTYADDGWHHVVGVLNPGTGRVDLYVDGRNTADYNNISPGNIKGTSQRPFYIGRATWGDGGSGSSWNGDIDEVRVYDRVLSEGEVQSLYNAGR